MKLYKCPKCGHQMAGELPNYCPNCACPSADFMASDVEVVKQKNAQEKSIATSPKQVNSKGCFIWILIVLLGFVILMCVVGSNETSTTQSQSTKVENYNDNSTAHQLLAKTWFEECIKQNLKDPRSYDEIDYRVKYNTDTETYLVSIKFRAKNSFGGYSVEIYSGTVNFTADGHVHCKILDKELL